MTEAQPPIKAVEPREEVPKPYIVSEDVRQRLQPWAQQMGFQLPDQDFFDQMGSDLSEFMQNMFGKANYEFVRDSEMTEGMTRLAKLYDLPIVALDNAYLRKDVPRINITRLVDDELESAGQGSRPGSPTLLTQFRQLAASGVKEIVLVDDVIFSGDQLERVINVLQKFGISVKAVVAGIGIGEGVDRLRKLGIEVQCVKQYAEVTDEVCQRDFYPGVPGCGRTLQGKENRGVPYILPFGKPGAWASIPEQWQIRFSRFCLEQTILLYEAIEKLSGRPVRMQDLHRGIGNLPSDDSRLVDVLRQALNQLPQEESET